MPETDHALLTAFAADRSEAAFRTLVERHLPVVWSCARRVTNGDHALAEDIAQQVFADLAAKAASLPPGMPLGGWLHRHAFFTATKSIRSESRRRTRESLAATTVAMTEAPDFSSPDDDPEALWIRLAPHLDAELAALPADDRSALVLRFFEKRSHRSVAAELGVSEEAARKRIDRALEKLRDRLGKKGVSLASGATLAALLPQSIMAPPAGLAVSLAATATATTAAGIAAGTATGWTTTASTLVTKLGGPSVVAGTSAGLALVLGGWWWSQRASTGPETAGLSPPLAHRPPPRPGASGPVATLPPLHASAFLVPDTLVAARLLAPHDQLDEAALYELVAATAGKADGSVIETTPVNPPVIGPGSEADQAKAMTAKEFIYPIAFEYARDGTATPASFATRLVGTHFKVNGKPIELDGTHAVTFSLEHHLAKPGETRWSSNLADPAADHPSVVTQPRFHVIELSGSVSLRPGETRLAGATLVPGWLNPRRPGTSERLLVFVTLATLSTK